MLLNFLKLADNRSSAHLGEYIGLIPRGLQQWMPVTWKDLHQENDHGNRGAFDASFVPQVGKVQELKCPQVQELKLTGGQNPAKEHTPSDPVHSIRTDSGSYDCASFASLIRQCGNSKSLSEGKRIHAHIDNSPLQGDVFLENLLLQMYGRCGAVKEAFDVFSNMHQRNVFSWAILIGVCVQNGQFQKALQVFHQMQLENVTPDRVTFLAILSACTVQVGLVVAKRLHACIVGLGIQSDVVVGTALVSMYGKCGSLETACKLFDTLHDRNLVSWNAIISSYAHYGRQEAFHLFQQMRLECMMPNRATFVAVLDASGQKEDLTEGRRIHACIVGSEFESDLVVGTTLVHMYGKCGSSEDAWRIFLNLPNVNVISWTAMIAAYARQGQVKESLQLFHQMDVRGIRQDKVTFISILDACANQAAFMDGKRIHVRIVGSEIESDLVVGNALVNMYGKCGSLEDAWWMFNKVTKRDLTTWNSIINAYAQHGEGKVAFQLFQKMQLEGMTPSMITFSSVLSACSRAGLVDEGYLCFIAMSEGDGIMPTLEHYNCMIDLLGRAGRLYEAENLINQMPFQSAATAWMTLLGACRSHFDIDRGQRAAECVFGLDPENDVPYVLLSNLYAVSIHDDKEKGARWSRGY